MSSQNSPEYNERSTSSRDKSPLLEAFPPSGQVVADSSLAWAKKVGRVGKKGARIHPTREPSFSPTTPSN